MSLSGMYILTNFTDLHLDKITPITYNREDQLVYCKAITVNLCFGFANDLQYNSLKTSEIYENNFRKMFTFLKSLRLYLNIHRVVCKL